MAQPLIHHNVLASGPWDSRIFIWHRDGIDHAPWRFGLGLGCLEIFVWDATAGLSISRSTLSLGKISD